MPAAATPTVRAALRHAVSRTDALGRGRRLLIGFSGGQDSTCLLHALVHLGETSGLEVIAAHVDHALRPTSGADAERVVDAARAIGVPIVVRRVEVGRYRAGLGRASVQQAARSARYQALAAITSELRADTLAVAHTADDQAETVLLNLLRGAGLEGLAGMRLEEWIDTRDYGPPLAESGDWELPPRLRVVRPLLSVERTATRAYCGEQGLTVVEDPSNESRTYTRNRVRLDLLPALEEFNPAIRSVLARMADVVGDDAATLEALAIQTHEQVAMPVEGGFAYADGEWRRQGRAIQRRLLRLAIGRLAGTLHDVAAGPVEDALDYVLAGGPPGRAYHLPGGVRLRTLRGGFELRRASTEVEAARYSREPGEASV